MSVAVTSKGGWLVGAKSYTGNPYDGHTLAEQMKQVVNFSRVKFPAACGGVVHSKYLNFLVQYPIPLKPGCVALSGPQIALDRISGLIPGAMMWKANIPTEEDDAPEDVKRKVANTISFAKHREKADLYITIDWNIA